MNKTAAVKNILWTIILIGVIIFSAIYILRLIFPNSYCQTVIKYCDKYGVDAYTAFAIMRAESGCEKDARSRAGAKGLMQITDETFEFCRSNLNLSSKNIYNIDSNIHAGVWYFSHLYEKTGGNLTNTLSAYNAGLSNVNKWLKDKRCSVDGKTLSRLPYKETEKYVQRILQYCKIYKLLYPRYTGGLL